MPRWFRVLAVESKFNFQHPQNSSHLAVTPLPGDPVPSSGLSGLGTHVLHGYTYKQDAYPDLKFFCARCGGTPL